MKTLEKFDVLVVGAGTGGCLAAKTIAEAGLKVGLVERKKREEIGEKICGDALGEHHLNTLGLEKPQNGELEKRIEGIQIFSPNQENIFTIAHEDFVGYLLNRRLFGQWLLKKAIKKGALLLDSHLFLKPIIQRGTVIGISSKNFKTGRKNRLTSKVVVDASGFSALVRSNLPSEMGIERRVANRDIEACYREIRQLKQETEDTKYCKIYLNQQVTPGGYTWIFPKGGAKVNTGVGVCMQTNFPNPKRQFQKHILSKPIFEGSLLLTGGVWFDPTRRPLDNMVGNGVIIVGDAACLVNPIHGGGIGPSMLSGFFAGQTIVESIEKGNVNKETMWGHNNKYLETYGKKQATLDIFRMMLLKSNNKDLDYGMNCKLMTEDGVLKAGLGDKFQLNITEKTKQVFRGVKRLGFLNKLRLTVKLMKQTKTHYENYPDNPNEFEKWHLETETLFNNARAKLVK